MARQQAQETTVGLGLNVAISPPSNGRNRMSTAMRSPDDSTDAGLIARWKAGDERAASELVARHAESLARFASSLGERPDGVEHRPPARLREHPQERLEVARAAELRSV